MLHSGNISCDYCTFIDMGIIAKFGMHKHVEENRSKEIVINEVTVCTHKIQVNFHIVSHCL